MRNTCKKLALVTIATQVAIPELSHATGGYWSLGFGAISKGMAGTGAAMGLDTMAAGINPAGMGMVGDRLDLGAAFFFPERGFTANEGGPIPTGKYESENSLFIIPHLGWNKVLDADSTIGISFGGNGGMNTEYDSAVFRNFAPNATSPTGIDLAQMFLGVTYTKKVADNWFGIEPIVAAQYLKVRGLEPFAGYSQTPNAVTNRGYDWSYGYGLRLGWIGELTDQLNLGISYQTRLYMSKFDKYSGLLAEQGDFDIPPTLVAGLAYKITPSVTLLLDYQKIWYGDIKSLANSNLPSGMPTLGSDNGLGFGWKNQDIYKIGAQWQYSKDLTLRAGYGHATKVFDGSEAFFNLLAPATVQDHVTFGLTYTLDDEDDINFAFTHALHKKISGHNTAFAGTQTGYVEMNQTEVELSWSRKF